MGYMVGGDSDKGHTITGGHQGPTVTDCVFVRDTISHLLWVGKAPLSRAEVSHSSRAG